ncbi:RcnB family protein [Sphingomonas sp. MMS12-HWE2-04]|uniref:RcnB family protein n=1 Tax=Sphingomonas sp. MMS12-HWE2-04 TaxID=3234199 RepID=UPI0038500D97
MVRNICFIAAATAGLVAAMPAAAQHVPQNGRMVVMPQQGRPGAAPMQPGRPGFNHVRPGRWGAPVNGRWSAGYRAPGGWNAYRRLDRGASLPPYWRGRDFRVPDYLSFGLSAPPRGYYWTRYYDDALLVDDGGRIWDSVGGIGWEADADAYAEDGYAESYAVAGAGYPPPSLDVDAGAYHDEAPAYSAPIPYPAQPYPGSYGPPAPPPPPVHVQTYQAQGAYQGGAYQGGTFYGGNAYQGGAYQGGAYQGATYQGGTYYAAGGTTTVVITPAPITTTTVIEEQVVEEKVVTSYVRAAPRKRVVRKWRPRPKPACCVCGCR